jgi:hypothetical protein
MKTKVKHIVGAFLVVIPSVALAGLISVAVVKAVMENPQCLGFFVLMLIVVVLFATARLGLHLWDD